MRSVARRFGAYLLARMPFMVRLVIIAPCVALALAAAGQPHQQTAQQAITNANTAISKSQVAEAISNYRVALEAQPGDRVILQRLIEAALSVQRPDMALAYVQGWVAQNGWSPTAYRLMARIMSQQGNDAPADGYWRASLNGTHDDSLALRTLAAHALSSGDWTAANAALTELVVLDPTDDLSCYELGLLMLPNDVNSGMTLLDRSTADPQFRATVTSLRATVIRYNNVSPSSLSFQLALTLMRLRAWSYAEHALYVSIHQGTVTTAHLALMGVTQDEQGRDGWSLIERAFSADPSDSMANYALALHWRLRGDAPRALQALTRAHTLNPRNPAIAAEIGLAYRTAGQLESAAVWLNQAVTLATDKSGFKTLQATFYADTRYNLQSEGLDVIRKIAAELPDSADVHASLGWALFSTNQFEAARAELDRALLLDSTNARARYYFAILREHQGDEAGAIDDYLYVYHDAAENAFKELAAGALKRLGYRVDANNIIQ